MVAGRLRCPQSILLGGHLHFGLKLSPGLCRVQHFPSLGSRSQFPIAVQKPGSDIKLSGGVHHGPPVTGPSTPNWATTGIFSPVLEQLTCPQQPCDLGVDLGGTVPWGSGADTQVLQCCSCSFPGSSPESFLLPSWTSGAMAVSCSTPEALHTPSTATKGSHKGFPSC